MDPFHERLARVALDVAAILASGRYSEDDLVRLAAEHDPGFDPAWFAEALKAVARLPDTLYASYGLGPQDVSALKALGGEEKISRD